MQRSLFDLGKAYPNGTRALDRLGLTLPAGMTGLPGPSGAGTSTVMRARVTPQEADAGAAVHEATKAHGTGSSRWVERGDQGRRLHLSAAPCTMRVDCPAASGNRSGRDARWIS